jgi:hypothetical protein
MARPESVEAPRTPTMPEVELNHILSRADMGKRRASRASAVPSWNVERRNGSRLRRSGRLRCVLRNVGNGDKMTLTRTLYKAARISNNLSAITSGKPKRIARRAKNVAVGRALGHAGVFRRLWR